MYRVGWLGWKWAARHGWPLVVRVNVFRDGEAGVYLATSDDLDGLVLEAKTLEELREEVRGGIEMLLEFHLNGAGDVALAGRQAVVLAPARER